MCCYYWILPRHYRCGHGCCTVTSSSATWFAAVQATKSSVTEACSQDVGTIATATTTMMHIIASGTVTSTTNTWFMFDKQIKFDKITCTMVVFRTTLCSGQLHGMAICYALAYRIFRTTFHCSYNNRFFSKWLACLPNPAHTSDHIPLDLSTMTISPWILPFMNNSTTLADSILVWDA